MTIGCEASAWLPSSHRFLFAASDGVHGCELHVSDGTVNNTQLLADLHPNGDALPGRDLGFHVLDQRVVFFDATDGTNGRQLWVSDGSANGTFVGDGRNGASGAVEQRIRFFFDHGRFAVDKRYRSSAMAGASGVNTSQQATVQSSMAGLQQPGSAWLHGDQHAIWFSAEDTLGDIEPHRLTNDGTLTSWEVNAFGDTQLFHPLSDENDLVAVAVRAGVKQLIRLEDDGSASWLTSIAPASGDTCLGEGMGVHRIGDNLLYDAVTNNNEPRLWTTNMANGISLQLDEEILAPGAQVGVANTGERLFFDCVTPSSGTEMCVTDGTPGGSNVFHDLTPGVLSSDIRGLVAVGDGAAMVSDGVTSGDAVGVSLWMIEGDELHMAYNPWPGTGNSSQALTYGSMTLTDSQVFFVAHDGEFGHEWHRWSHGELSDDWIVIDRWRDDMFSANAIGARHADHIILGCLLLDREGLPAGKTHHCIGLLELGIHRNTLIEDKTIPLPVVTTNGLEITQHTAFELFHVREPCFDHDGACLLTPYPTGAEHHDGFVFHGCW